MRQVIQIRNSRPPIWLDTDIAYATVPAWYGHVSRTLRISMMRPADSRERTLPCLVWLCGGAWLRMNRDIHLPNFIELARLGFIIASVEYRCSSEARFPAQVEDVKAAVRFLRAHARDFGIDSAKIGVMGESAGGHLASVVGASNGTTRFDVGQYLNVSSSVQAACSFYGPTDLGALRKDAVEGASGGMEPQDQLLGAKVESGDSSARNADPVSYLSGQTCPFLLIHGTEDKLVSTMQSERLYRALEEAGVDVDLLLLSGAGHGTWEFLQPTVIRVVGEFFARHLNSPPLAPPADPATGD